ncbi:hypothetical protein M422DRAFT_257144 [Sphaerobolus stellatus SS14]|uniref:Uncharacterized protein n=1 Tax=Sphaerobolus stellatus (strain SS14) TaxID=990650 RepID=A0A0C9VQB0_SPHS4|nr:hypothetical protein M422DRAFT_257144 [Sphaerobolus stellatus SS14]
MGAVSENSRSTQQKLSRCSLNLTWKKPVKYKDSEMSLEAPNNVGDLPDDRLLRPFVSKVPGVNARSTRSIGQHGGAAELAQAEFGGRRRAADDLFAVCSRISYLTEREHTAQGQAWLSFPLLEPRVELEPTAQVQTVGSSPIRGSHFAGFDQNSLRLFAAEVSPATAE